MAGPPKAQEVANVLKPGGEELTDEAVHLFYKRTKDALENGKIDLPFPCVEGLTPAGPIDLEDREKYPDFYNFWVKGIYTTIAKSLNVNSQFSIPVFDPTALGFALDIKVPNLGLPEIFASFAAPIPLALQLLNIKPPQIPDFSAKALGLIVPAPPVIKIDLPPPWLPDINFFPFGSLHVIANLYPGIVVPGLPGLPGIPGAFANFVVDLLNPKFWIDFNLMSFFKLACQTFTKPLTEAFISGNPHAAATPPVTAIAAASAMGVQTADSIVFAATGATIGAGAVVSGMSEMKGYKPKAAEKIPSLYSEAALNGLVPFEPDPTVHNVEWVFRKGTRNTFFADPFIAEYLYELAKHLSEKFPNFKLEVGNITGKDENYGWRWSKWSTILTNGKKTITSHYGSAMDVAYPMKRESSYASGMNPSSPIILGEVEGSAGESPYRPHPTGGLPSGSEYSYDFEVMYEMFRWTREDFIPSVVSEGRLRNDPPLNAVYGKPEEHMLVAIVVGAKVGEKFYAWQSKNLKKGSKIQAISPDKNHEDHIHFRFCRSRLDAEATKLRTDGKSCYLIPWKVEVKFGTQQKDPSPVDRAVETVTKELPDGTKIKVVV